jgi:CBS domain containing-hemolysin-like protein
MHLLLGALTLVTNAFFVGAEFALITVRATQVEPLADAGNRRAQTVLWALAHLSPMLATAQLGITVSSLVLGAVAEPAIEHLLEPAFEAVHLPESLNGPVAFVVALSLATYLHMLLGEMVPKNIALAAPRRTALLLGPPLVALTGVLRPLVFGINSLANGLLRLLHVEPKDEVNSAFTDAELARLVTHSTNAGLLDAAASERLLDALELFSRTADEIVVPTERMVTVPAGVTPRQLEQVAAESGFSRFPVMSADREVRGYLHVKDVLGSTQRDVPVPAGRWRPVISVSHDLPLHAVLTTMRAGANHLAAVVGPADDLLGFVTMANVLEELVGPPLTPQTTARLP